MSTAVAEVKRAGALTALSESELVEVLQNSLYPGAKLESCKLVLSYCKAGGLDPLQKPVHIVPMDVKVGNEWTKRDVIMPGVGLYRTQASRTGQMAGLSEPVFGPMQTLQVGEFKMEYPEWCKVTAKRVLENGIVAEYTAVEYWLENYATKSRDTILPNAMWKKRPRGQIVKCAEAQALRKAFPDSTGAAATADEMEGHTLDTTGGHDGNTIDGDVREVRQQSAEKKPYDQALFEKNWPAWEQVVATGRKTPDEMIAWVEAKGAPLSEEQKKKIRAVKVVKPAKAEPAVEDAQVKGEQPAAAEDPFTAPTYAEVANAIVKAADADALNAASDMIRHVADETQRAELTGKVEERAQELSTEAA